MNAHMNILCRLGLHSWKPVCRDSEEAVLRVVMKTVEGLAMTCPACIPSYVNAVSLRSDNWAQVGSKCRRCGKREAL